MRLGTLKFKKLTARAAQMQRTILKDSKMAKRKERPSSSKSYVINLSTIFDTIDIHVVKKSTLNGKGRGRRNTKKRSKRSEEKGAAVTAHAAAACNLRQFIHQATIDSFQCDDVVLPAFRKNCGTRSVKVELELDGAEAACVSRLFGYCHDETRVFWKWKFDKTSEICSRFRSILCDGMNEDEDVLPSSCPTRFYCCSAGKNVCNQDIDKLCLNLLYASKDSKRLKETRHNKSLIIAYQVKSIVMKLHKRNDSLMIKVSPPCIYEPRF